jgi:hypothetical protein
MWINPPTLNWWDQIFVMNDGTTKFWFNAIGYLGYNGAGGWFDCQNNNADNALTPGKWTFVTINISTDGFAVYYDGKLKFDKDNNGAFASGDFKGYTNVLNMFTCANNFYLGYETWWKAAPALIDDMFFVTRPLTEKEIQNLYADTKKASGGVPVSPAYATFIGRLLSVKQFFYKCSQCSTRRRTYYRRDSGYSISLRTRCNQRYNLASKRRMDR